MIHPFLLFIIVGNEYPPLTAKALLESAKLHPRYALQGAWGEFIARWPWEWFATFTFAYDTHPERALKLFYLWRSKLNREIYGPRWHKREPFGATTVVATEDQKSGQIHLHALVSGVGDARRLTWMDNWESLGEVAGFSRIYPVEINEAVSSYVTKYVTKGGDIYLSENLRLRHRDLFDPPTESESGS